MLDQDEKAYVHGDDLPDVGEVLDLNTLWKHVEQLNKALAPPDWHLPPVMGGGMENRPRFACVFINPTHRNVSTRDDWLGPRFPWIGTKAVWRVLAAGGLLPRTLSDEIDGRGTWDESFAAYVYQVVADNSLYITNLVKWTGGNGDLPSTGLVKAFLGILRRELEIVRPRAVVAFGGLTFQAMTGRQVKLSAVLDAVRVGLPIQSEPLVGTALTVFPCYFPTGRGNPRAAAELLAHMEAAVT